MPNDNSSITLPAIRGVVGNIVYYSSFMTVEQLQSRLDEPVISLDDFAPHSDVLTKMVSLRKPLREEPWRLAPLVIGVSGGESDWTAFTNVNTHYPDDLPGLKQEAIESTGFLTLSEDVRLSVLVHPSLSAYLSGFADPDGPGMIRKDDEVPLFMVKKPDPLQQGDEGATG